MREFVKKLLLSQQEFKIHGSQFGFGKFINKKGNLDSGESVNIHYVGRIKIICSRVYVRLSDKGSWYPWGQIR